MTASRARRAALLLGLLAAAPAAAEPSAPSAAPPRAAAPAEGDPNDLPRTAGFRLGLMLDLPGTFTGFSLGIGGIDGYRLRGVTVGLLGVGHHGADGLTLGGGVIGGEGDVTGLSVAGLGMLLFGGVRGVGVAGVGILGPELNEGLVIAPVQLLGDLRGVALGAVVVSLHAHGLVIAPAVFAVPVNGSGPDAERPGFTGLSLSAVNWIRGEQRGLAIGIFNYADQLHGVQLGLFNIARNNPPMLRVLPLVNAHFD
ncbi:MAG TPA: hypothetical protein VLT47_01745 [Anaeromyxobacteraceae bacterium]|nr:hypothetical protein [Anaeromyxobacteraceae bacterium]